MSSVNYSLRPSKAIQRHVIFGGIRSLQAHLDFEDMVYVGFGSVWFSDFFLAHRSLGIRKMVSIEADEVTYRRALFNAPFSGVSVRHGMSGECLPELLADDELRARPWLLWLDYTGGINEDVREDLRTAVEMLPANSVLLTTFSGHEMAYGNAPDRPDRLREIFGAVVPDNLTKNACKGDRMQETLAELTRDFMVSVAADTFRPGGFIPAFRAIYQDGAPMVTVGGILPTKGAAAIAADVVGQASWKCCLDVPIRAPHLTFKEASVLQAKLPADAPLTRDDVRALGFDLEEEELAAFQSYYLEYPAYAQIVA